MIFINSSFINQKDISFQIGFIIAFIIKEFTNESFIIVSNIVYFLFVKYKRIIYSVLASKVYGFIIGFNIAFIMIIILRIIITRLKLSDISFILYINLYSLYKCLVKLGITDEKRLIINLMAFCQLYKRREIIEIWWIYNNNNPFNAIIKNIPNPFLKQLITIKILTI